MRAHLTVANTMVHPWLGGAQALFMARGQSAVSSHAAALAQLSLAADRQALMLSFDDAFLMIAVAFLCALPLVFVIRRSKASGGPGVDA